MADRQFLQLLNAYLANPRVPLALPASVELQNALFDQAKVYIRNSLYSSQVADAQHAVELAWAIAGQTGLDEHRALASWCSGLLHANRDVRKSSRHLEEALAYYRQAHKAEEEGRLLFGYASQLNLLGRLEEAEQAVQRSIECLAATPDYRDWPLIYINLAYIQGQRGRYVEMLASARQAEEMAIRFEAKVA
jgi:tetratricopeptide (TPR) repeat protein